MITFNSKPKSVAYFADLSDGMAFIIPDTGDFCFKVSSDSFLCFNSDEPDDKPMLLSVEEYKRYYEFNCDMAVAVNEIQIVDPEDYNIVVTY